MSTDVYQGLDRTFAIHVGGHDRPDGIDPNALRKFARSVAMNPKRVVELGEETADRVEAAAAAVLHGVGEQTDHPAVLDRIDDLLGTRLVALRAVLRETSRIE